MSRKHLMFAALVAGLAGAPITSATDPVKVRNRKRDAAQKKARKANRRKA